MGFDQQDVTYKDGNLTDSNLGVDLIDSTQPKTYWIPILTSPKEYPGQKQSAAILEGLVDITKGASSRGEDTAEAAQGAADASCAASRGGQGEAAKIIDRNESSNRAIGRNHLMMPACPR